MKKSSKDQNSRRIVIIGPAHPLRGGLATYNHRLAQEFKTHGHHVHIQTFTVQYPDFLFPGKTQYSKDPAPKDLKIDESINSINPLNWILVGRKIKKAAPDIVIVTYWLPLMSPCFGTILRIIKSNKHSRIISIIHNLLPHEKRIGDRLFTKYFVKPIHGFIVQSKSVLNDLASFNVNENVQLIPHPIYDNFGESVTKYEAAKKLNLPEDQKYILFFGFIRDYKGLDILLKSLAEDVLKPLDIKLIVAGEFYNNEEEHLALIKNLNIEDKVLLHTFFISNEDVRFYFGISDLVVQPYKSATQSGISQMAYHFEKPMIVTNVGGLPEIVPNAKAGYVTEVNPIAVADAIFKFYDKRMSGKFRDFIKEKKKEYSWERMMNSVLYLAGYKENKYRE